MLWAGNLFEACGLSLALAPVDDFERLPHFHAKTFRVGVTPGVKLDQDGRKRLAACGEDSNSSP